MDTSIMKAKDIAKFTKTEYGQLAVHARGLIVRDMEKGKLQKGSGNYKEPYKRLKGNGFVGKSGNRYAKYANQSLSRHNSSVNMILTGQTKNRIRPEGKSDRALLVFERGSIVEANEKRGYVIRDLNKDNRVSSVNFMQRIVNRKIAKYASKPINIKIGK